MNEIKPPLQQAEILFPSDAPINVEKLSKQNKIIYEWLAAGNSINCFEAQDIGITALNSRCSDLRNKHGVVIHDKFETASGGSKVKRYFFPQFNPFANGKER